MYCTLIGGIRRVVCREVVLYVSLSCMSTFCCFSQKSEVCILLSLLYIGAILLSGVQCSKLVTYLTVCIGWFMIETILYTELAARHYCPADNIGKFELRTIYCYFKHNS